MAKKDIVQDEEFFKGETVTYKLEFEEDGDSIDISDWTIYFTVKSKRSDSDSEALINKKVDDHSDPTIGETKIELSSSDTNITVGHYVYAIDYKDDEGNGKTVLQGRLTIKKPVRDTRD